MACSSPPAPHVRKRCVRVLRAEVSVSQCVTVCHRLLQTRSGVEGALLPGLGFKISSLALWDGASPIPLLQERSRGPALGSHGRTWGSLSLPLTVTSSWGRVLPPCAPVPLSASLRSVCPPHGQPGCDSPAALPAFCKLSHPATSEEPFLWPAPALSRQWLLHPAAAGGRALAPLAGHRSAAPGSTCL